MNKTIKYFIVAGGLSICLFCAACSQRADESIATIPDRAIPIVETMEDTAANPPSESESETETEPVTETILPEPVKPSVTYEDYEVYYTSTRVNVRTQPSLSGEVIATLDLNTELKVAEFVDGGWSTILFNEQPCWIYSKYLSKNPIQAPEYVEITDSGEFHYYGIWAGDWWHFTPEQIDNQWAGYKKSKPVLEPGTTRAWQSYLYEKLSERDLSWWYKYACAQAMQESGFNPLNNAGTDHGLFSFRITFWNSNYGDVHDYHANIDAYVDRIYPYLANVTPDNGAGIDLALSQHYNPGHGIILDYVNAVRTRLVQLWICD